MTTRGVGVDDQSRCAHWHGESDVVALRLPCCGEWYACRECHDDLADHTAETWPPHRLDEPVARCGACGRVMSGAEYLGLAEDRCPACDHPFNPGCRTHCHLYFSATGPP